MIAGGAINKVTSGVVILTAGAACPTGYTRVSALDSKFLQANSTYNAAAGGTSTHQHPAHDHSSSHTVSLATSDQSNGPAGQAGGNNNRVAGTHNHGSVSVSFSGSVQVDAADHRPLFANILLCQKD